MQYHHSFRLSLFPGRDDFLPVSKRPRQSLYPMLEVDKALEITLSKACRKSTQDIVLANGNCNNDSFAIFYSRISNNNLSFFAHVCGDVAINIAGYIIAEDICASLPLPPFPASIKDGYAVVGK